MESITGRGELLLTRHRNIALRDPQAARRAVRRGELVKLRSGALVRRSVWDGLTEAERQRLEIAAAADAAQDGLVISDLSAAALWGIPLIRRPDGLVHTRATAAAGTRTEHGFRKHAVRDMDQHVIELEGIRVTSLPRTVVDLALSLPFEEAVVATDWALGHGVERDQLTATLDEVGPKQRRWRAERVFLFGDARSGSVGESRSRAQMEEAGLVLPELQRRFDDADGFIGFVDFYWPQFALIGEFDGKVKVADPAMRRGREPWQVVIDEKIREDRLRGVNPKLTRWMWDLLNVRGGLAARLLSLGVSRR